MMPLTTPSRNEYLKTGVTYETSTSYESRVINLEVIFPRPRPIPNTVDVGAVFNRYEADPLRAQLLARSRQRLSTALYEDEPNSFSALRLATGLSQTQLAERVETSQSHIARIELGKTDPGTDMVVRLAAALHVDPIAVFNAIRHQRDTRGQME